MKKKRIISLAAALLLAVMLVSSIPFAATAENGGVPTAIDCTDPSSAAAPKEIKASDFLSLLGADVGDAEAKYVDAVIEEALIYSDRIPSSKVKVNYDGEKVYVSASSYEYLSAGGISVKWIPYAVTVDGKDHDLSYSEESQSFECEVEFSQIDSNGDQLSYAEVKYSFELTVPKADAERFLNYTYTRAVEIDEEICEYELALAAYNEHVRYLEEKKEFDAANALYEQYLIDKAAYDKAYEKYEQYLVQYKEYEDQLEAYRLYRESVDSFSERLAAYEKYLDDIAVYDADMVRYENYRAVMEKAERKLAVMENMFIVNSKGQVMYSTLMGPTVQQVLENQDLLISYGKVDGAVISQTGDATDALRELLGGYKKLTDFYDKYNYYVENYDEIKANFIILYQNLHQLFENEAVYAGIVQKERLNRYVEFVSHLYVLQSCLDDRYALDQGWRIHREYDDKARDYVYYGYGDVLEACQIPTDNNNFSPDDLMTLPAKMDLPQKPTEVEPPAILPTVEMPQKPDPVYEPACPTEVQKPVEPASVPYAEKPVEKKYPSVETRIRGEYLMGKLNERSVEGDVKLTLATSLSKLIAADDKYVVVFYDDDGTTVLHQYYASYLDTVRYDGELPTKKATKKYTYTFSGWKNDEGEDAVFGEITEYETVFYASYTSELNEYKVVWSVDGNTTSEFYKYGETPSFGGNTEKAPDERYVYTFSGWDTVPEKVVGNAIYTAQYTRSDRLYTVAFDIRGVIFKEQFRYGEMPTPSQSVADINDGTYVYLFKGWDRELTEVEGDTSYVAQFEKNSLVQNGDGDPIEVTPPDPNGENKYSASVSGNAVKTDTLAELAEQSNAGFLLSWLSGECSVSFSETATSEFVSKGGAYVSIEKNSTSGSYSLRIYSASGEDISLEAPVSVVIKLDGVDKYTGTYLRDADGNETRIPATYSEGALAVKLSNGGEIILKREYSVTVNSFAEGAATPDKREATAGDTVAFTMTIDPDHQIKEVTVVGDLSGKRYELAEGYRLTMPDEPVTVTVSTEKRRYTVIFTVDGAVISEKQYYKGDVIERPADPTKESTDEYIYQFLEWDPLFKDGTAVSGDVTYNAVFKELLIEDQKGFVPQKDNKFIVFVITVVSVFLLVMTAMIVGTVILVKKNKKRKSK